MYVLLAPVATIIAVVLTLIFTNRREERRQAHERELKRMEFEHQKKQRAHEAKVETYSHLLSRTATLDPTADAPLREVAEIVSRIEIMADSEAVLNAAHHVLREYYTLDKVGREAKARGHYPGNDSSYVECYKRFDQVRNRFLRTAKKDLGSYAGEEEKSDFEDVDEETKKNSAL